MRSHVEKAIAALRQAKGEWLSPEQLAERLGIRLTDVPRIVGLARREHGYPIETSKWRGVGWRLPVDAVPSPPEQASKPAAVPAVAAPALRPVADLTPLSRQGEAMLAQLQAVPGQWVTGKTIADPLGLFPSDLARIARHIMTKRPHLKIEGKRGWGYRLVVEGAAEPSPAPAPKTASKVPHQHYRSVIELLGKLAPRTAEQVRDIALQSGQTADEAIERLLWYGIEVHRDLAASQNPLSLVRRAA